MTISSKNYEMEMGMGSVKVTIGHTSDKIRAICRKLPVALACTCRQCRSCGNTGGMVELNNVVRCKMCGAAQGNRHDKTFLSHSYMCRLSKVDEDDPVAMESL